MPRLTLILITLCLLLAALAQAREGVSMSLLHQGERGLFADSAVVDYTTSQVVEAADFLPNRILPAYVGTGYLGMAVDA